MLKEDLVKECSTLFKVHVRDLMGPYRYDFVVRARQALFLALRRRGWSYPDIGWFLKRDHSTVIHGVKRALYIAERDPDYAAKVEHLTDLEIKKVSDAAA
jgi:chromosomal replication initiation ATPase DnaA